jgi:hypothetical protein
VNGPSSLAIAVTGRSEMIGNLFYSSFLRDRKAPKVGRNDPCPCERLLLDALITFLKKHPDIAAATDLHQLTSRTGPVRRRCSHSAIWVEDRVTLRLKKYSEDWEEIGVDYDPFDPTNRTIHEDISEMSDKGIGESLQETTRRGQRQIRRF